MLQIAEAKLADIYLLEKYLPSDSLPDTHRQRFQLQQQGQGLYLLAWQAQLPISHLLLHFRHPQHHASYQHYPDCAYIEALTTHKDWQRRGVAFTLMQRAEILARDHAQSVGLSVALENLPAQSLYRKMGYQLTNLPPYQVTWNYLDKVTGELKEEGELCAFWIKIL